MAIETIATAAAQTAPSPAAITQSASYRKYLRGLRRRALIIQAWQIGLVHSSLACGRSRRAPGG